MTVGTIFKLVEVSLDWLTFFLGVIFIVYGVVSTVLFARRLVKAKRLEKEQIRLFIEWYKSGAAIVNWLKAHLQELTLNQEAATSNPEFQELLRKDFEIYERVTVLVPRLKKDPVVQFGADLYKSLIKTENIKPS